MFLKKGVLPHQLTVNGILILSIIISFRGLMACFYGVVLFCLSTIKTHEQHDRDKNRNGLQNIYHYQIQDSPHHSLHSRQLCNSRPGTSLERFQLVVGNGEGRRKEDTGFPGSEKKIQFQRTF